VSRKFKTRIVSVKIPERYIEELNKLVESGRYRNISEVIRVAIRDLLLRELWLKSEQTH